MNDKRTIAFVVRLICEIAFISGESIYEIRLITLFGSRFKDVTSVDELSSVLAPTFLIAIFFLSVTIHIIFVVCVIGLDVILMETFDELLFVNIGTVEFKIVFFVVKVFRIRIHYCE